MCGILGGINTRFDAECVARLNHRGPDQHSLETEPVAVAGVEASLSLGQTRLNIVDRHDIDLPVRIGKSTIVFNGEIYNWLELKAELESLGRTFATRTDTEVALAAYLQWGADCLERFNGMFALAIWDGERFFCARDRMGKKPLFYRVRGTSFEFASEVKAFSDLEFIGSDSFDLFEFCHDEHTLYKDVFALRPGAYLVYEPARGTLQTRSYWDIPDRFGERITDEKVAVDRFIEVMEASVKLRMRADVPVTMFLSGGIDSSLVACLAGVKEAFTCQFDEFADTINEERYASDLAQRLGIELHFVRPTREEFLADLSSLAYFLEMPTGSFSVFPLYRLAKACHDAGYKVILSGEGSDELFGGYARNEFLMLPSYDAADPRVKNYLSMLRRFEGSDLDRFCRMASRAGLTGAALMKGYLTHLWSERKSMLDNMCYVEARIFIQPLLQMADRMCMAHSIEGRCPFLDPGVVEFAFSLDDSLKYRDGVGKWIVKAAAQRLLPKGSLVLEREVKHGLPTPVNLWMQGRHSFDRKYWNALMTAECIKNLQRTRVTPELSVIAPCLNEELNVPLLCQRSLATFDAMKVPAELVLVDDGSTDRTWEVIEAEAARSDRVRGARHDKNRGIIGGWLTGLATARAELVCLIDSDLQNRPEDIPRLFETYQRERPDLVQGVRHPSKTEQRKLFSRALNHLLNGTFGMHLQDNKSGFILCRREVLADILEDREGYRYFQAFVGVAAGVRGYRFAEVDTEFNPRHAGESFLSNFPVRVSLRIIGELMRYRIDTLKNPRKRRDA